MKRFQKIISLFLVFVMIACAFSGCGGGDSSSTSSPSSSGDGDRVELLNGQTFAYAIIISGEATEAEREAGLKLSQTVRSKYGTVKYKNDESAVTEGQKEILIGNTTREGSNIALKQITDKRSKTAADYIICMVGDNIAINATNGTALIEAVDYFIENLLFAEESVLTTDYSYLHSPKLKTMTIDGNDIADYSIVIPSSDAVFFEGEVNQLAETLRTVYGVSPEVVTDDAETLPEHRIAVGTGFSSDMLPKSSTKCRVVENDGNLYVSTNDKTLVHVGIDHILSLLLDDTKDSTEFASGYDIELSASDVNLPKDDDTLQPYELVWADEFNGNTLNSDYWNIREQYLTASTGGKMYYTSNPENVSVHDGMLYLTGLRHETEEDGLTSGYIRTMGHMIFRYGYFEIRAKLPNGNGTWPAFWAKGPESNGNMELDMFERFTINMDRVRFGLISWWDPLDTEGNTVQSRVSPTGYGNQYYILPEGQTFGDDFHTFGCEWTPESINYYVDGNWSYAYDISGEDMDIYHTPLYLILCHQFGVAGMATGVDETTPIPSEFIIDYIRLYQRPNISMLKFYD